MEHLVGSKLGQGVLVSPFVTVNRYAIALLCALGCVFGCGWECTWCNSMGLILDARSSLSFFTGSDGELSTAASMLFRRSRILHTLHTPSPSCSYDDEKIESSTEG